MTTAVADKTIVLIEKNGGLQELKIKSNSLQDLYKKAGLKSAEGFQEQFVWEVETEDKKYSISLYAKKTGKNARNTKNTYDFPAPLEEAVFYGNALLVNNADSLTKDEWLSLYDTIYEKYEIVEEEGDEMDESEEGEDDEGEDAEEAEDEDDGNDDDETVAGGSSKRRAGKKRELMELDALQLNAIEEPVLDCSKELEPEPYI